MNKFSKTLVALALTGASCAAVAGEIAVIVNAKHGAGSMNAEQVSQFFLGKNTTMTPIDQADGSGVRTEFYKKVADKEASQVKAIWSKLVFTGKANVPKDYPSSAEVKKAVAADPNAIGYIEKGAVDGSVKVVLTLQ